MRKLENELFEKFLNENSALTRNAEVVREFVFAFEPAKMLRGLHIRADAVIFYRDVSVVDLIEVKRKLDLRAISQARAYKYYAERDERFKNMILVPRVVCSEAETPFIEFAKHEGVDVVIT